MNSLNNAVQMWSTPNIPDRGAETRESKAARGAGGVDLQTQAGTWLTPSASEDAAGLPGAKMQMMLSQQARSFPSGPQDPETTTGGAASRPRLNPLFVEWLMGWPLGVTGFALSATAWSRYRQRMRSALCGLSL